MNAETRDLVRQAIDAASKVYHEPLLRNLAEGWLTGEDVAKLLACAGCRQTGASKPNPRPG